MVVIFREISSLAEYISKFSSFYHTTYPKTDLFIFFVFGKDKPGTVGDFGHSKKEKVCYLLQLQFKDTQISLPVSFIHLHLVFTF